MAAFSLVESMVGMATIGTLIGALLSGFTSGIFSMQMARENLRATQIMLEKVETIRLYSWDQINDPDFIPRSFTATYDPQGAPNVGLVYNGTVELTPAPVSSSYSNQMVMITVRVNWKTGNLSRVREFTSYISRHGLQQYVY